MKIHLVLRSIIFHVFSTDSNTKDLAYKRLFRWFCGLNVATDNNKFSEDDILEREKVQMNKIHETKRNKIILGICAVIVILIDIFLYIYWSVRY